MANRGLNAIHLMGHLGGDAKKINSQRGFGCHFNVATTRRYKTGSGEWKEETTWVRCTYWNAEKVFGYLKQGRQLVIEGHLVNFPYTDSGGKELKLMEVAVDALILTDYKSQSDTGKRGDDDDDRPYDDPGEMEEPEPEPKPQPRKQPAATGKRSRMELREPEAFQEVQEYRSYLESQSERLIDQLEEREQKARAALLEEKRAMEQVLADREAALDEKIKALSDGLSTETLDTAVSVSGSRTRKPHKPAKMAQKRSPAKRGRRGG